MVTFNSNMPITRDAPKDAIRCSNCRKLIGTGSLKDGKIAIKCKCGTTNIIEAIPEQTAEKKFIYNTPYQNRIPGIVRK